jgi:CelD/BcsL family acetyltransferase involved in cellulose biosynthesis
LKVEELNEFESLKSHWDTLLKDSVVGNSVYLTWEWLATWWKHFGKERRLLLLTVTERNKILAIAPLMLSKYKITRIGPSMGKVEFLGTPYSDYSNFIILEKERDCLRSIFNYLKYEVSGWNWIRLSEILESSSTAKLLREIFPESSAELIKKEHVCSVCSYISLPESFGTFMKELGRKQRQSLNRNLRRLQQSFSVEFKSYKDFGFSVDEAMRLFFKLHRMRWKEKNLPGIFEQKENVVKDFHLNLAKTFAENEWLGLYFLTLNNEPVSALYNFEYGQKSYGYLTGFDPKYASYSIGSVSIFFLIEKYIQRGFRDFDMLRGVEPYKNFWTSTCRRNFQIEFTRATPVGMLYEWVARIKRNMRANKEIII